MTIYCQGEVKEVEEEIDKSVEVREIPHLAELYLAKHQKDLPKKMSITEKVSPRRNTEASLWSVNEGVSGSLF